MILKKAISYGVFKNYYYDDQTALESEFSMELFERADSVRFWVELNVERNLEVNSTSQLVQYIKEDIRRNSLTRTRTL